MRPGRGGGGGGGILTRRKKNLYSRVPTFLSFFSQRDDKIAVGQFRPKSSFIFPPKTLYQYIPTAAFIDSAYLTKFRQSIPFLSERLARLREGGKPSNLKVR